jgi:hypothetical protein
MNGFETFCGATIRLFQADVLVVLVASRLLGDRAEAPLVVAAFQAKFGMTIVLAAQDTRGVPTFFGPGPIATVLARIPFEALGWKRYRFSRPKPLMLPIPSDPLPDSRATFASYASEPAMPNTKDLGRRRMTRSLAEEDGGATRP